MIRRPLFLFSLAVVLAATSAHAQSLEGTVVRNPDDTVTYTIDVGGPPSGSLSAFVIPFLQGNWFLPGSDFAPFGWSSQFLPAAGIWQYNPLTDIKSNLDGTQPQIWANPQFVLKFEANAPGNAVLPGQNLGGFGFVSPQLPVNGPALWQNATNPPWLPIDPLVPGPIPAHAVPVPAAAPAGALGLALVALVTVIRRRRG